MKTGRYVFNVPAPPEHAGKTALAERRLFDGIRFRIFQYRIFTDSPQAGCGKKQIPL
jgi:hypothetical protein